MYSAQQNHYNSFPYSLLTIYFIGNQSYCMYGKAVANMAAFKITYFPWEENVLKLQAGNIFWVALTPFIRPTK